LLYYLHDNSSSNFHNLVTLKFPFQITFHYYSHEFSRKLDDEIPFGLIFPNEYNKKWINSMYVFPNRACLKYHKFPICQKKTLTANKIYSFFIKFEFFSFIVFSFFCAHPIEFDTASRNPPEGRAILSACCPVGRMF
jgi:hypothetical protein